MKFSHTACAMLCLTSIAMTEGDNASRAQESATTGQQGPTVLGIVAERPADGRFVETDRGFMVPYTTTIPGTNVTFTMLPIPGGEQEVTRDGVTYYVEIEPFWMGTTEVTWAEYQEYMRLRKPFDRFIEIRIRKVTDENEIDAVTAPSLVYDPNFLYEAGDKPNQPATSMRQYAAKQYTKWLSLLTEQFYRLPSEAEWEYACQAGSTTAYSYGDDPSQLGEYAWYVDNVVEWQTGEVGTKLPNAWGLHDIHGNVAEWVLDGKESLVGLPDAGSKVELEDAILWPSIEYQRIAKGGSWDCEPEECTTESRLISVPDWLKYEALIPASPWWLASEEGQKIGFRIMRPLDPPPRADRERFWKADLQSIRDTVTRRVEQEGRGERGLVDPGLPEAIKQLPKEED